MDNDPDSRHNKILRELEEAFGLKRENIVITRDSGDIENFLSVQRRAENKEIIIYSPLFNIYPVLG